MTNLDSIFKSRNITLPRKVHLVKAMDFPGKSTGVGCQYLLHQINKLVLVNMMQFRTGDLRAELDMTERLK